MKPRQVSNGIGWKVIIIAIIWMMLSAQAALANAPHKQPEFQFIVEKDSCVGGQVTVQATGLWDMYAYELTLETNAGLLKLAEARSLMEGFQVGPNVKNDYIVFAATKVGVTPGVQGDAAMATFTFERVSERPTAQVSLLEVKLVDSDLGMKVYSPNIQIALGTAGTAFVDTWGHWAARSICLAAEQGWIKGYNDGTVRPDNAVTRAEFAAMLERVLELSPVSNKMEILEYYRDSDLVPDWATSSLAMMIGNDLMNGYDDGTMRPNQPITRAEIAVVAERVRQQSASGSDRAVAMDPLLQLSDASRIPGWARDSVSAIIQAQIMVGRTNGHFAPNDRTTRAEAIKVIMGLLAYIESAG